MPAQNEPLDGNERSVQPFSMVKKHISLDDLARMVGKGFEDVADKIGVVRSDIADVRDQMATHDDLRALEERLIDRIASKEDTKQLRDRVTALEEHDRRHPV